MICCLTPRATSLLSGTEPLDFCPILCNDTIMKKTLNVYEQQLIAQGRDLPKAQPSTGKVPARFADRFATFEEYQEAMADFLNGM